MHNSKNTDEHIAGFPSPVKERLEKIRAAIKKAAPKAEETISYGIPTFKQNGNLVHFAGYKNHIGFYPGAGAIESFKKELAAFETSKGTVQLPHDKPLPLGLISQIVKFRVMQNNEKAAPNKPVKAAAKSANKKTTDEEQVNAWLKKLSPAVKKEIDPVRTIIKAASNKLKERIKWNAPSYYTSVDILTFGPYKKDKILLVFHHPAVVKVKSVLLEGDYKDRRLVYFKNSAEAEKNKKELTRIIKELVKMIDK
jgi:uncharacterized protein YdhG (YjbR/CyaY superfamily)